MDSDPETERILDEAFALPEAEWLPFVERACRGRPDLRDAALRALSQVQALGHFLEPSLRAASETPSRPNGWATLLAPGDRVGDFVIEALHAVGGTSEVYRARHARADAAVAVKVWHAAEHSAPPLRTELAHRHLVEVLATGVDDERGLAWIAMRFVEGPSMQSVLEQLAARGMPASSRERRLLLERCQEVAAALASMHALGLVHGDVKPANILFDCSPGRWSLEQPVVLVDLGSVRPADRSSLSTVFATAAYAAPELLLGLDVDARADVFGLGVTMHDLLAGRLPRERAKRPAAGLEPLHTLNPAIDADLSAIVEMASHPTARWRHRDAAHVADDLAAWHAGRRVSARPRSVLRRWWRRWQRRPGHEVALAGALVALAAAFGLLLAGILWTADMILTSRTVAEHWARGDLAATQAAAKTVPAALHGILLPAALAGTDADAIGAVLSLCTTESDAAALLHAARFLARDGPLAHADLVRWFTWSIDQDDPTWQQHSAALAARLFLDRPPVSAAEARAYAPLCSALERRARAAPPPALLLPCIAALGGCGGATALDVLLGIVEGAQHEPDQVVLETNRLAVTAMSRLTARLLADGEAPPLATLETMLQRTGAALAALEPRVHGARSLLCGSVQEWFMVVACARRRLGQTTDANLLAALGPPCPLLRAAAGDLTLLDELRATRSFRFSAEYADPAHAPFDHYMHYERYGLLAGLLGPAELENELGTVAHQLAIEHGLQPAHARTIFGRGFAAGRTELAGRRELWSTDPDSRLGRWFEMRNERAVPLVVQRRAAEHARVAVAVDCEAAPPALTPLAKALTARAVQFQTDDYEVACHYAWLGVPGVSSLRTTFTLDERANQLVQLELHLQMAARQALPWLGEAGIDIVLDGRPVHEVRALLVPSAQHILLPLFRATSGGEHTLEIRLRPEATTTVRLFQVTLTR